MGLVENPIALTLEQFKALLSDTPIGNTVRLTLLSPAGQLKDVTITVARFSRFKLGERDQAGE